jgi:hypothetical protein
MKYYYEVANVWTTKDYHCVYVVFYNEDHIPSWDYTFYDLQQFLDEENDEEYHSVELKFDPITIQFPCVCINGTNLTNLFNVSNVSHFWIWIFIIIFLIHFTIF